MTRKLKFENKLLIGLTLIIGLLIVFLSIGFYRYFSSIMADKDTRTANRMTEQFTTHLDTLFQQVDSSAIVLVNNGSLRESVISLYNSSPVSGEKMLEYENEISKNLLPISYAFPFDFKTILFNNEKNFYFASGMVVTEQDAINARLSDLEWYRHLIKPGEQRSISPPHPDEWSANPRTVVSIYRKLATQYFDDYATLEIQIPYKELEKMFHVNLAQPSDFLVVLDDKGELVFPYDQEAGNAGGVSPLIQSHVDLLSGLSDSTGQLNIEHHPYLYALKKSDFSGWTMIYFSSQEETNRSLAFYRNMIIVGGFVVWLVVLSAIFILLNRLTRSLKRLIRNVRSVRLSNLSLGDYDGDDDEFLMLNEEFNKMFAKLKDSISESYESKIREADALRLALQAQINPHFLYNTLNAISAAGEQYGSHVVTKMCSQLAGMMRYSTSSKEMNVSLKHEMTHVRNYLELIAVPYEGLLSYSIELPEDMESLTIPKLILQPIVENSVNHGFENSSPPWEISIRGERQGDSWTLVVEDNGAGIDADALEQVLQHMQDYRSRLGTGETIQPASFGGMGLPNVYMRLWIQYKESAVLHIENRDNGGCRVTIGGKTDEGVAGT